MAPKKTMGRKKIDIEKIAREDYLQVAFSKRRSGLFKKASELCTLCGAEIAIVVFSPAGKAFSFGHPSVEAVVDRFQPSESPLPKDDMIPYVLAHRSASVRELNGQYSELLHQLEVEKKRGEELKQINKASQEQHWWNAPIENLNLENLEKLRSSMEELKMNVLRHAEKPMIGPSSSSIPGGMVDPTVNATNDQANASYVPDGFDFDHMGFDFNFELGQL